MKIRLTSIYVDDQRAARDFYTNVLGFEVHHDIPLGDHSWLTVVSPEDRDGPQLLLEPSDHPAVGPYREALVEDGIPMAQFAVDDVEAEHDRLVGLGVTFTQPPTDIGPAVVAVLDDTCGNLVQLITEKGPRRDERLNLGTATPASSRSISFQEAHQRPGPKNGTRHRRDRHRESNHD